MISQRQRQQLAVGRQVRTSFKSSLHPMPRRDPPLPPPLWTWAVTTLISIAIMLAAATEVLNRFQDGCFLFGKLKRTALLPVGPEQRSEVLERGVQSETENNAIRGSFDRRLLYLNVFQKM